MAGKEHDGKYPGQKDFKTKGDCRDDKKCEEVYSLTYHKLIQNLKLTSFL